MGLQASDDLAIIPPSTSSQVEDAGERLGDRAAYRRLRTWLEDLARRGLRVEVDQKPGRTILHLHGRLDRQSVGMLKTGFQDILTLASKLLDLDLAGMDRVDGAGLAALVWAWRLAGEREIELRLTRMRPSVREIVARMNLHYLLQIVDDGELVVMPD